MRKKSKKLFLAMLFVLMALPVLYSQPAQAASKKSKALKAYKAFLAQSEIPWGTAAMDYEVATKNCEFTLAYINNDSVPELVVRCYSVSHAARYGSIYTYKSGKVTGITNVSLDDPDGKFQYYKKRTFIWDIM